MANKKNLLLLFENPGEPVFTQKGKNNAVFDMPEKFLDERYQPIGAEVQSRFGDDAGERIPVKDIQIPNLSAFDFKQLGKQENFSLFIPKHRKIASALTDIFMSEFTNCHFKKNLKKCYLVQNNFFITQLLEHI